MNTSEGLSPREAAWDLITKSATTEMAVHQIFEMLRGRIIDLTGDMTQDHYSAGWLGAMTAVLDLLDKPHPATQEPTLLEQYADVLCALMGHEHTGRPRCSMVPVAERLLALHEAVDHPLITVVDNHVDPYPQTSPVNILDVLQDQMLRSMMGQPSPEDLADHAHGPLCPHHAGHRWCRRTQGHVGMHVDTQGSGFGGIDPR